MEYALEGDLKSFGRGFTVLEKVMAPRFAVSFTHAATDARTTDPVLHHKYKPSNALLQ